MDRRRLESAVFVFAALGAMLIVPPLVLIFNQPISHFGIPQIALYLFAVWLVLIIGTAVLTHFLPRAPEDQAEGEG